MKLSTQFAGTAFREYTTIVKWRDTMNYAAAVGDNNPAYFDDEAPGGIIAPPMFGVAATWPISGRLPDYIESEDFPREVFQRQVHYTEHLEFHRPIVPGDKLVIRGKIAAVAPHPAGTYIAIRYDAGDAAGSPVFTEHIGGLLRGVACEGEGRGTDALPHPHKFSGGEDILWTSRIAVDPLSPFVYDGCTGIFFPIHTSKKFAHRVGLPDIILQGTATLALAVREVTNREAAGKPALIAAISCRFTDMVFPGDTIDVQCTGREIEGETKHVSFRVQNGRGKFAVSGGYVRIGLWM